MAASDGSVRVLADNLMKITKIKVKKGQKVSKGSLLCLYGSGGKDVKRFKANDNGIISHIYAKEGVEVQPGYVLFTIRECSHPTVMKDMCADCGADLRVENSTAGNRKEDVSASVAMVHSIPELIVSEKLAKELGKADEDRLLKTRKLVLLVDLDQTLIHTTNDNIPANLKDVHHFQLWHGNQLMWYHTRMRPQTVKFLQHISELYELHICTFGVRMYAHTIARILDPEGKFFSHRILSRDECFNSQAKTANLKALFPCGDSMVCIIDDREDVWHFSPNLVHVKPYRFFQGTADINAPPGLTKTEEDDKPMVHRVRRVSQSSTDSKEADSKETDGKGETNDEGKKDNGAEKDSEKGGGGKDSENGGGAKDSKSNDEDRSKDTAKTGESGDTETTAKSTSNKDLGKTKTDDESDKDKTKAETDENEKLNSNVKKGKDSDNVEGGVRNEGMDTKDSAGNEENDGKKASKVSHKGDAEGIVRDSVDDTDAEEDKLEIDEGPCAMETEDAEKKEPNDTKKEEVTESETNDKGKSESGKVDNKTETECKSGHSTVKDGEESKKTTDKKVAKELEVSDDEAEDMIEWDDEDDYLFYLEEILKTIHQTFYHFYDHMKEQEKANKANKDGEKDVEIEKPSLKNIIPYIKKKALKGCNIVFSGVIPTNMDQEKSRAMIVAKALGANVQQEVKYKSNENDKAKFTSHLVAARAGTTKVRTARKCKHVKIVSPDWLWSCSERWEKVEELLFPVAEETAGDMGRDSPDPTKLMKKDLKRKHDKDNSGGESRNNASASKRQKTSGQSEEGGEDGSKSGETCSKMDQGNNEVASGSGDNKQDEKTFSLTYNPMMAFSDDDLAFMDKEVDEEMDDSGSDLSSEEDNARDARLRDSVLKCKNDLDVSSSEESMTGDMPRGWGLKNKLSPRHSSDDEMKGSSSPEIQLGPEYESETDQDKFEKIMDVFGPETENSEEEYQESIGSVDDEFADAVLKEFLS